MSSCLDMSDLAFVKQTIFAQGSNETKRACHCVQFVRRVFRGAIVTFRVMVRTITAHGAVAMALQVIDHAVALAIVASGNEVITAIRAIVLIIGRIGAVSIGVILLAVGAAGEAIGQAVLAVITTASFGDIVIGNVVIATFTGRVVVAIATFA